ncbi:unnamed protein product [Ambrosiozyma monospora]|uniref:Unnamed protein product n=1 Tax=Ambrosiozyma monospora TaxID=43982 RepID=A0A9W7DMF4_AMBMO|nr:unnamed protein product [Ambrosiozyma monospora]
MFRFNGYTTVMKCLDRSKSIFSTVKTLNSTITSTQQNGSASNNGDQDLGFEVLAGNIDGSFYKVIPINDAQYRRLYAIQNYIVDRECHPLGLNPKLDSIGGFEKWMNNVRRPIVDFKMIQRFIDLDDALKKMLLNKLGQNSLIAVYQDVIGLQ